MDEFVFKTSLERIGEHIWAIDQEMVRSFLIVGSEKALLFDTGVTPCDLMGLIRSVTDKPVILVQSHGDGDHTANSGLFPTILAHPLEYENILFFRPELKDRLRPTAEGSAFDLGGIILEVVETPGHTPGSVCLLDRAHRVLYSGDTVSHGSVFLFGPHRDIHTYRQTLEKLWALDAYDTVYPCHNTCPITRDAIPELMAAVDGALDGSLAGTPMDGPPFPHGEKPLSYIFGSCEIAYEP